MRLIKIYAGMTKFSSVLSLWRPLSFVITCFSCIQLEPLSGLCSNQEKAALASAENSLDSTVPTTDGPDAKPAPDNNAKILKGKAETRVVKDANLRAWQASQVYKQATLALNKNNLRLAADLFKKAGEGFDIDGCEKFQAQAFFAEAQTRRLLGQTDQASKLYQAAIDLFNDYDPLSPYLKGALDNLKKVSPKLAGQVMTQEARLNALMIPTTIMKVDRNVVLKGGLSDFGSANLLAEKGTADVQSAEINKVVHQAFVRMTCLETAELGSNSITAENRWYPLLANGRTVAIGASSDFLTPSIKVRINERFYNIGVELPGIGSSKRTVFLLTDGNHIVAIEPNSEDMWSLVGDFKSKPETFYWKKLSHIKAKRKVAG
jgi:hypothetical protein